MADDSEGVAVSDRPEGPFGEITQLPIGGIDPAVFIDNDGQAYLYWGQLFSHGVKLGGDMMSLDRNEIVDNLVTEENHFFHEGSSMRRIGDTYYYVYADMERGKPTSLGYSTGPTPFGPFTYRGIIIDNDGCDPASWNNHGSIECVNGQWYVFYHRQTGRDEYSRQAMLEPIDAAQGKDGKVWLGRIIYRDGKPIASCPVEMTSQGPQVNGLNAREWISAGYACHLYGGTEAAWIEPVYEQRDDISAPIKNITNGTAVGFRYLQFGLQTPKTVTLVMKANGEGKVSVRLDTPGGKEIAKFDAKDGEATVPVQGGIIGKHAVYFVFCMKKGTAEMDWFTFDD
jgi:hypothetical protein